MKRITTLLCLLVLTLATWSQTTLNFKTHALLPGHENPMELCKYLDPGMAGLAVQWDFTNLEATKGFKGYLSTASLKGAGLSTTGTNVELIEFNSRFFFEVNEQGMKQTGFSSKDGKSIIEYHEAFQKAVFPFKFNDYHQSSFSGEYKYNGNHLGQISGVSEIEADGYGSLKLPGHVVYDNVLRIKSVKKYTNHLSNLDQEIEIITYRWYNNAHRFPLLVLTEYSTKNGDAEAIVRYQAAYNNKALTLSPEEHSSIDKFTFSTYPNPSNGVVKLDINSKVESSLELKAYDMGGNLVFEIPASEVVIGNNTVDISSYFSAIPRGNYHITVTIGNQKRTKTIAYLP